jgi:hypothetical protein
VNAANCTACLASRGYYLSPTAAVNNKTAAAGVFHKAFLRFHPPKWTMLSLAYKRLVNGPLLSSLREGVIATNGSQGGTLIQKMLPQSCNGAGRPLNQKLDAIDGLNYTNTARPLAEMLFNTAWFMGGGKDDQPWVWTNLAGNSTGEWNGVAGTHPGIGGAFPNSKSGPCNGCNSDFAILFSDGRGDVANPGCTAAGTPSWCTAANLCAVPFLGAELDGDHFELLNPLSQVFTTFTGPLAVTPRQTPANTCDMDLADDVAGWMGNNNVSSTGTSGSVTVHVVGIGDDRHNEMSILRAVASRSNGNYVQADNFRDLEDAIEQVFAYIRGAASSFASSAVTTVQTTGTSSAFIPRFTPAISGPWSGSLSRFVLYNEFAAGCTSSDLGSVNALNPNGDNSCSDFYLRDSLGNFIQENDTGAFIVSDNSAAWAGGWPAVVTADGGSVLAVPYGEGLAQGNRRR